MTRDPKDDSIQDVLYEAAYRIRAAFWVIEQSQDRDPHAPDMGGYDFVLAREALQHVADALMGAADAHVEANRPRLVGPCAQGVQ